MKPSTEFILENDYFSASIVNDILMVKEKMHILNMTYNIDKTFSFYDDLDTVAANNNYKAIAVVGNPDSVCHRERISFLLSILSDDKANKNIDRLSNIVNQIFLLLSSASVPTIYAGSGRISFFHFNLSLAHDFRVVARDTLFENYNTDLGIITKGSGYFLPRLVGFKKAVEIMQWRNFTAEEAMHLGLVDSIVSTEKLVEEAVDFLNITTTGTRSTLLAIRKLLKFDTDKLKTTLALEDKLIKNSLISPNFKKYFDIYCSKHSDRMAPFSGEAGNEERRAKS
uniref:Enoyl-CoA hydratase/carnithine racemase n=1 Tax=Desulfovibrio sp. U5L TaxID=596152 RepID=I2Q6N9_9BACT